jgi:hypothetical protein
MGYSYTPGSKPLFLATYSVTVKNNDESSATIYADVGASPPTTSQGSCGSESSIVVNITGPNAPNVVYVRAKTASKDYSEVVSHYFDGT